MQLIEDFVDWAAANIEEADGAIYYLSSRGVSRDQIRKHRIGFISGDFIPDVSRDPRHNEACDDREKKSQWCESCRFTRWSTKWEQDPDAPEGRKRPIPGGRIRGSIVLPLTSYSRTTVGFQIRSLHEKVYDTFLTRRRPEGYFFGLSASLDSVWARSEAWIVEGPFDQLILERLVAPNVVAITTSSVSRDQGRFLRRFTRDVNMCLDMDTAGRQGVSDFFKYNSSKFRAVRDVRYPCRLPKEKDVGDLWKRVGDDEFRRVFQKITEEFRR